MWIRPGALLGNAVKGYTQIVGHTELGKLEWRMTSRTNDKVLFIDSRTHESIIELDTDTGNFQLI
jgi:hypothetical protein